MNRNGKVGFFGRETVGAGLTFILAIASFFLCGDGSGLSINLNGDFLTRHVPPARRKGDYPFEESRTFVLKGLRTLIILKS
jgi:hypothetical protein